LHCYRVLVAWTLEHLPGPSVFKWKTYAVLANAGAAVALGTLCLMLGLSRRAATYASWLAAFGFGSLYTLFDPYTSDPLMFLLGPVLMTLLIGGHFAAAGIIATVGALGKEFAIAPLWIFTIYSAVDRAWQRFARVLFAATTATLIWTLFHLWLTLKYNYSYGGSASADVFGGGYIRLWASYMSPRVAASVLFAEFGALFLLIPVGLFFATWQMRQLTLAAVPALVALAYVQQPDRALWNFHFLVTPLAAIALDHAPVALSALIVVAFATANLRVGAQLTFVPAARFALAASVLFAIVAVVMSRPDGLRYNSRGADL
jgi:hypothetical protein